MDNQFGIPVYHWPKKTRVFRTIMSLLKHIAQALSDDHDFPNDPTLDAWSTKLEALGGDLKLAQKYALRLWANLDRLERLHPEGISRKIKNWAEDGVYDVWDEYTPENTLQRMQVLKGYLTWQINHAQEIFRGHDSTRRTGQSEDFPHVPSGESLEKNLELRGANIPKARDLAAETIDLSGQLRHNESLTQLCESSAYFGMESVFDLDKLPRASQEDVEDSVEHRLLTKYLLHSVEEHSRISNDRADELYEERRDR